MTVCNGVEAEFVNWIESVFLSVFRTQFQDHAGNIEFPTANRITSATLETDILDIFTAFTAV